MDLDIEFITSWLTYGSRQSADILVVLGISGIGKTSLAKYVFKSYYNKFQESNFLEGISRNVRNDMRDCLIYKSNFMKTFKKKKPSEKDHDVSEYTSRIENALAHKKVFLVLDDIDSLNQLNALLGRRGFHPGSKIIITTKDKSLTRSYIEGLYNSQVQPTHTEVCLTGLYKTKALELLYIHAFKCKKPKEGYEEVSENLVNYCQGHPLALTVLGESLHNRDVAYWEGCIEELKKGPDSRIQEALLMSFTSLTLKNDKDLFKHIACFFVGADRDVTEIILKACDINTRNGITNLIDKCLLSIGRNNTLMMHQLIQEMGRDLVRQESPNKPWERTRIWCHEESFKVLKQKKGNENILGLTLDTRMLEKKSLCRSFELKADSLSHMDSLMLLQLNYVQINGLFENCLEELRWLCMHGFPSKSMVISSDLPLENLVVLDMSYSKIESFDISSSNPPQPAWRQKRLLGSLKILDLSFCEQLLTLGGFLEVPALERLIVKKCISLFEVCESIEQCVELVMVDLSYCYKLKNLPILIRKLKTVKTLTLDGCNSRIEMRDMDSWDMVVANFGINSQTSSSATTESIPRDSLSLAFYLPPSLVSLSLQNNNLSIESFPNDFSSLSMLKYLYLDGNPIITLPACVRTLPRLEELHMGSCHMLISIELPPRTVIQTSYTYRHSVSRMIRDYYLYPEMSPYKYFTQLKYLPLSSVEIDGVVKIQPIASVGEKMLHSLGWSNLEFLKERCLGTNKARRYERTQEIQMYYEFGIFSTIYGGKEMPNWIEHKNKGSSISFTILSSPKKLLGLNFCCVEKDISQKYKSDWVPLIKISNITKGRTWTYKHLNSELVRVGRKCLIYLSHWMFGINEMESDDQVTITVRHDDMTCKHQVTSKCGMTLVYDDGKTEEDEEDVLGYYKSWNHIISGDLSNFQLTTGEYILNIHRFQLGVAFKAFSQRKSSILDGASQKVLLKGQSCSLEKSTEFAMETDTHNNTKTKRQRPLEPNHPDKKQRQ